MEELESAMASHGPVQNFRRKRDAAKLGYPEDGIEFRWVEAVVIAVETTDSPQESSEKRPGVGACTEPVEGNRTGLGPDRGSNNEQRRCYSRARVLQMGWRPCPAQAGAVMLPHASIVCRQFQHETHGALDRRNSQAKTCVHSAREVHVRSAGVPEDAVGCAASRAI